MKNFLLLSFDRFWRWVGDVLSADGNQSTTRVVLLSTWLTVLTVWGGLSVAERKMLEVPTSVLELAGTILLGKCWQNHTEAKTKEQG